MKNLFVTLQLFLLAIAAYQVTGLAYRQLFPPDLSAFGSLPIQSLETDDSAIPGQPPLQRDYRKITDKNLFNVLLHHSGAGPEKTLTEPLEKPLQKTTLQLALWGTVTAASDRNAFAVIENAKTGEQSLFQVGDPVEGGIVQKIDRNRVVLRVNGQDQLLEVDTTRKPAGMASSPLTLPEPETGLPQPMPEPQQATGNRLPDLMKQARIRPFFSDGRPDGLLLYGIRNDSIFQQIGLKNGDIIKSINGSDILSAQDAVTIYQSLNTPLEEMPDIRFTIQRRGKIQEIVYNAQNNQYTEETASDE
jgi:general secretion pathway protein C